MDTLKKELWELLRIFNHICREEHIDYWVDYGTLLGAVRHQGFIPWDDDIDVSMRYEDYLRFFEVCAKYFPPNVPENPYARRLDQMNLLWKSLRVTKTPLSEDKGNSIARTAKKSLQPPHHRSQ